MISSLGTTPRNVGETMRIKGNTWEIVQWWGGLEPGFELGTLRV